MNNKYNSEDDIEQSGEIKIVSKIYDSEKTDRIVYELSIEKRKIESLKSIVSLIIISDFVLLIFILSPLISNSFNDYINYIYYEIMPNNTLYRMNILIFVILWILYIGIIIYN